MTTTTRISAPVAIIGGGIMGCATAYYLAKQGVRAVVLEKRRVAAEGSGLNAGGVRAQCRDRRERPLAMQAVILWQGLARELGTDVGYDASGNLRLASTPERLDQLAAEAQEEQADGLAVAIWDAAALRNQAPYLGDGFVGGKFCPTDGVANPVQATLAYAWAAQALGATIAPESEVTELLVAGGAVQGVVARQPWGTLQVDAPLVLHAGGPWTPTPAARAGVAIPIRAVRLTIGATAAVAPIFQPFLSSHDLGVAARPLANGQVYVSGFGHPAPDLAKPVLPQALAELRAIDRMVPALAGIPFVHAWTGLLDVTPDEIPVLGPVDGLRGYWVAAGFSGHGFCLGPAVGMNLAAWMVAGAPMLDLSAFQPGRFTPAQLAWEEAGPSSVLAGRLER